MKRSRDGEAEAQEQTKRETVFIVSIHKSGGFATYSAQLTEAEIALLVPAFVGSKQSARAHEVLLNGPASGVLKKIYHYRNAKYDLTYVNNEPDTWYEQAPVTFVPFDAPAATQGRTIVWYK